MKKQFVLVLAIATVSLTSCEEDSVNPSFIKVIDSDHDRVTTLSSFYPESGEGGTEVTIFGENFGRSMSDNTVTFNGINSEILQVLPGKITVRVPISLAQGYYQVAVSARHQTVTSEKAFFVKGIKKSL